MESTYLATLRGYVVMAFERNGLVEITVTSLLRLGSIITLLIVSSYIKLTINWLGE